MNDLIVKVTDTAISCDEVFSHFKKPGHGAVVSFFGVVRNINQGRRVTSITYDAHQQLAERVFGKICEKARARWKNECKILLTHRIGTLNVGEISVAIVVSSPHRKTAFRICRYIIEELKIRAPIWKQEHDEDGVSRWLKGHCLRENENEKSVG